MAAEELLLHLFSRRRQTGCESSTRNLLSQDASVSLKRMVWTTRKRIKTRNRGQTTIAQPEQIGWHCVKGSSPIHSSKYIQMQGGGGGGLLHQCVLSARSSKEGGGGEGLVSVRKINTTSSLSYDSQQLLLQYKLRITHSEHCKATVLSSHDNTFRRVDLLETA